MPAIVYRGTVADAKAALSNIVDELPRTTIVKENRDFLHVEFRSLFFRFVDDVELYVDEQTKVIHFRSASRMGYSDLGVNRKRMQTITDLFHKSGA